MCSEIYVRLFNARVLDLQTKVSGIEAGGLVWSGAELLEFWTLNFVITESLPHSGL